MIDATRPWTALTGDCKSVLADLPDESVDACVTDTPYGLSTLLDPPNLDREALWRKLLTHNRNRRSLRAYVANALDVFMARESRLPTRDEFLDIVETAEYQRLIEGPAIERLIKSWLDTGENPVMKGRGFMGKEWDALVPAPKTWRAVWRVLKPGANCLAFGGTRTADLITLSLRLADFEIEDTWAWLQGQGMPKRVRLDLKIDEHFGMKDKRPVLGKHPRPSANKPGDIAGIGGSRDVDIHGAATPEAAKFVGWDRASAPKYEPIIVACKPMRGTIAETALRYGTGGLNADGCRIPRGDAGEQVATRGRSAGRPTYDLGSDGEVISIDARGGFPANVLIDEEVAAELDRQSGTMRDGVAVKRNTEVGKVTGRIFQMGNTGNDATFGGSGGASKFFYTAKASTSERDKGLEDLPVLTPGERSGGREDGSAGISGYAGTRGEKGRNPHPTVKPISLMRYLVRRACPPGAWDPEPSKRPLVLDCFMGSGSTGVAAMVEGVRFVGVELDPQMVDVATRRLQHAYALPREEAEDAPPATRPGGQVRLF